MSESVHTVTGDAADQRVHRVLGAILRHPTSLLSTWNWKAAAVSAIIRALMFLLINLRSGHASAEKAMLVEAVYATFAAGLLGSITQHLRHTVPRATTALIVWAGLPALLLIVQYFVHRATGTPRLRTSLIASFVFAAFATGFNWFAMQRGAMLTGGEASSTISDLRRLPIVLADFLLVLPRAALRAFSKN
jgi:hypothetical protein